MNINDITKITYTRNSTQFIHINDEAGIFDISDNIVQKWLEIEGNSISEYEYTLDELKQEKKQEANSIRKIKQYEPFNYTNANGTFTLPNTEKAKVRYIGKRQSLVSNGATTKVWLDVYKNPLVFTQIDYEEIIKLIEDAETLCYTNEATIIAEIEAITDIDTLKAYNVQERWEAI